MELAHAANDVVCSDRAFVESLVKEVEKNVKGQRVFLEGEDDGEGEYEQGSQ